MNIDIKGIERGVRGFSKAPDKEGDHIMMVEYKLKPVSLNELRNIFQVNMKNNDPAVLDIIYPLSINEEQAKVLNKYVIGGEIDLNRYLFELHCWQKE